MLPAQSKPTTRQGTMRWRARLTVPPSLVNAANSKSVPIAKCGLTPKKNISTGVINEPPPTPVIPTISPTKKPEAVYRKSILGALQYSIKGAILTVQNPT